MKAMYPLLCNPDEHVLSTIGSLVLALLEGKTDLPISGVFGAGKTRSAAILMVGLLVFEPNLKLVRYLWSGSFLVPCSQPIGQFFH